MNNNLIKGVDTPVDGKDAVNKDFVLANSGGNSSSAVCQIICGITCPDAPTGWSVTRAEGNSNQGRCDSDVLQGKETMCCYFSTEEACVDADNDGVCDTSNCTDNDGDGTVTIPLD